MQTENNSVNKAIPNNKKPRISNKYRQVLTLKLINN